MKKIRFGWFALFFPGLLGWGESAGREPSSLPEEERIQFDEDFFSALKERAGSNPVSAIIYLNRCLEKDSTRAEVCHELAKNYADIKDDDSALKYSQMAHHLAPQDKWYQTYLLNLYLQKGMYAQAIPLLQGKALDNPEYAIELVHGYLAVKDYKEAHRFLDRYRKRHGEDRLSVFLRKEIYMASGNYRQALRQVETLLSTEPDNSSAAVQKSEILSRLKGEQEGILYLEKYLEEHPGDPGATYALLNRHFRNKDYGPVFEALEAITAEEDISSTNQLELMDSLKKYVHLSPDYKNSFEKALEGMLHRDGQDASLLFFAGQYHYLSGDAQRGTDLVRRSIDRGRIDFQTRMTLLIYEMGAGQIDSLYRDSQRAAEVFPDQPAPLFFHGLAAFQKKQYRQAARSLEQAKEKSAALPDLLKDIYSHLGACYHELKDYPRSDENYRSALKMSPKDALTLNNYAYHLSERGEQLDRARKYIEQVILVQKSDNPTYLDTYAWVLFRQGEYARALQVIEQAIRKAREDGIDQSAEIREHYGDILQANGRQKEGILQWEKALEDPEITPEEKDRLLEKIETARPDKEKTQP